MIQSVESDKTLYVYLDEAGNFDFSASGTSYFVMSALSVERPFPCVSELSNLKYDLWERGLELEYFHASKDTQLTRDKVFDILKHNLARFRIDSIIMEKRKTHPTLQKNQARFYMTVLDILLGFVLEKAPQGHASVFVATDNIPLEKKRKEIEKGVKVALTHWARKHQRFYRILHMASKSDYNLQIADYVNWAIYRKWERNDSRSYDLMRECVKSEFEVFESGTAKYY